MPLERGEAARHDAEQRIALAAVGQLDLMPADLAMTRGSDLAAGDLHDELGAEADAERRRPRDHQLADQVALGLEPAERLVDLRRAAEDERRVVPSIASGGGGWSAANERMSSRWPCSSTTSPKTPGGASA